MRMFLCFLAIDSQAGSPASFEGGGVLGGGRIVPQHPYRIRS